MTTWNRLVRATIVASALLSSTVVQRGSAQPRPVNLFGVERQRDGDNQAAQRALDRLRAQDVNPVVYSNKEEMVAGLVARLQPDQCIQELTLHGHGSPGKFMTGNGQSDSLRSSTYIDGFDVEWRKPLQGLLARLCRGATITLWGCNVGAGEEGVEKLVALASFFYPRATVRAPVDAVSTAPYFGRFQEVRPEDVRPEGPRPPAPIESTDRDSARPR